LRAPPPGADALYVGYDREFPRRVAVPFTGAVFDDSTFEGRFPEPPAPPGEAPLDALALGEEVWDEESSRARPVVAARAMPLKKRGAGIASAVGGALAAPVAFAAQAVAKTVAPRGSSTIERERAKDDFRHREQA